MGVRTGKFVHREELDILNANKQTHKAPLSDRHLTAEVWYLALVGPNERKKRRMTASAGQCPRPEIVSDQDR